MTWLAALTAAAGLSAPAGAVTVDLLILYDSATHSRFNGQVGTAMSSWVNQMNVMNQNSQVDIQWRLVGVEQHDPGGANMDQVLVNVTRSSWVRQRRDALGADYVAQIHRTGACGVAWMAVSRDNAFAVNGPSCGPVTLAHELGHAMGLAHSRRNGDTAGARYRYGLGHGVDGRF